MHRRNNATTKDDIKFDKIEVSGKTCSDEEGSIYGEVDEAIAEKSWWKRFYYKHVVVDSATLNVSLTQSFLYNYDLKPVEEDRRLWSWHNYLWFWLADCFNISTWQVAATGMQLGLNW